MNRKIIDKEFPGEIAKSVAYQQILTQYDLMLMCFHETEGSEAEAAFEAAWDALAAVIDFHCAVRVLAAVIAEKQAKRAEPKPEAKKKKARPARR
jgi:hypothetical protein